MTNTKISLIGAPTDIGAGSRGASMGPEAMRVANIATVLAAQGLDVLDKGKADAVLAASIFHFGQHTIPEAKKYLAEQGIEMRL